MTDRRGTTGVRLPAPLVGAGAKPLGGLADAAVDAGPDAHDLAVDGGRHAVVDLHGGGNGGMWRNVRQGGGGGRGKGLSFAIVDMEGRMWGRRG